MKEINSKTIAANMIHDFYLIIYGVVNDDLLYKQALEGYDVIPKYVLPELKLCALYVCKKIINELEVNSKQWLTYIEVEEIIIKMDTCSLNDIVQKK